MSLTRSYAAQSATSPLAPWTFERRAVGTNDVSIKILYCGVCHSDIHTARGEWSGTKYPIVPGHEIVGTVTAVGAAVKVWKVGDTVGVGCIVDSCRECASCKEDQEQFCENGMTGTYNGIERGTGHTTQGGYSQHIVVDENYVLRIPAGMPLDRTAPLLCAGITTYSPLRKYGVKAGMKVAIVGLGGLGHMGVKIAKAMGAHVTVVSHSDKKRDDAKRLGADDFLNTGEAGAFRANAKRFDFILDTVSAEHDYNSYLMMVRRSGTMVVVGIPPASPLNPSLLVMQQRCLAGSLIGGIAETQEMLDFCAEHQVFSDIEVIPASLINEAYERMLKSDVRYRFVIDCATLE
ncbi:MAG: NAD(P)-dependent alcohol dehydrogenase [Flavobacteriales bacterium]